MSRQQANYISQFLLKKNHKQAKDKIMGIPFMFMTTAIAVRFPVFHLNYIFHSSEIQKLIIFF